MKKYQFCGVQYSLEELAAVMGYNAEDPEFGEVYDRLVAKGKVMEIKTQNLQQEMLEEAKQEVSARQALAIEESIEQALKHAEASKSRQDSYVIPAVELDFMNKAGLNAVVAYLDSRGLAHSEEIREGSFVITAYQISADEFAKAKRIADFYHVASKGVGYVKSAAELSGKAADFTVFQVGVPVAKAALSMGFHTVKTGARLGVHTGAVVLNGMTDTAKAVRQDLREDKELLKAQVAVQDAYDNFKRLIGLRSGSSRARVIS